VYSFPNTTFFLYLTLNSTKINYKTSNKNIEGAFTSGFYHQDGRCNFGEGTVLSSMHLVQGGFYLIATVAASRRAMKKAACV
jgi:hypothetical protein